MVNEIVKKQLEEDMERIERMIEVDTRNLEKNKETVKGIKEELGVE